MKLRLSVLFIAALFLSQIHFAYAQHDPKRVPLTDPYQEYIFNLNQFYTDRRDYEEARNKYISYQTEQSKADAINASKLMLESGRYAIYLYIGLSKDYLAGQDEISTRVKSLIQNDLTAHLNYFQSSKSTIDEISDLAKAKTAAEAYTLHYGYFKTTAQQALNYADGAATKKQLDSVKAIVAQFNSIITGFPDTNRSRLVVSNWVVEATADLTSIENDLNRFIESIYPEELTKGDQPGYQSGQSGSPDHLNSIKIKLKNYVPKLNEMNTVIKKAYSEL